MIGKYLIGLAALAASLSAEAHDVHEWTLVIHGGAGVLERSQMTAERDAAQRAALTAALEAGRKILREGGTALDAVQAAIIILEDDPGFNAGKGAVFNAAGSIELDAAIMDGRTRDAGAVAGITATKNPIELARAVMEQSPHVMLQSAGADEFSKQVGLEQVPNSYFETDERRQQLEKMRARAKSGESGGVFDVEVKFGTVGAVARDRDGNLAAATSTGGLTGKRFGRVGDTPILGAGTYADNAGCAVSATGAGEFYIRANVAAAICARMRYLKEDVQVAADAVQADMKSLGGSGGVIAVAPDGTPAYSFNTPGMYRGMALSDGTLSTGIYGDEQ
ncbi:isoaspartyl peptidase/L-asparaginase [Pacificimonas sp. WHA3]|uniref:Isoaspartyl peptidase/L-asparaginase n=1 Tax=Pacificimonas pallii TaxID=2827236 RepID=A0ABS6SGU5_9SPHN|nr:isoaspartyl peptidase/L-asparaginase [Pacificimonas pallii]MBV7257141.1 isoaspartyl peptidase/L-asparaginase [Pacificimonas pallii]